MDSLRYVVLRHEGWGEGHFDLMFETAPGSALATWRSATWPPDGNIPLTRLADHRREYLEYEGPIFGNRGSVRRVDRGICRIDGNNPRLWIIRTESLVLTLTQGQDDTWSAVTQPAP